MRALTGAMLVMNKSYGKRVSVIPRLFNVAPIHWCEQIKTKNTGLRSKARVSMLGLNQFLGKRVCVIR
jgi:hypothetical protein